MQLSCDYAICRRSYLEHGTSCVAWAANNKKVQCKFCAIITHLRSRGLGSSIRRPCAARGGHGAVQAGQAAGGVDLLDARLVLPQRRVRLHTIMTFLASEIMLLRTPNSKSHSSHTAHKRTKERTLPRVRRSFGSDTFFRMLSRLFREENNSTVHHQGVTFQDSAATASKIAVLSPEKLPQCELCVTPSKITDTKRLTSSPPPAPCP
jgi:hypothetical protein